MRIKTSFNLRINSFRQIRKIRQKNRSCSRSKQFNIALRSIKLKILQKILLIFFSKVCLILSGFFQKETDSFKQFRLGSTTFNLSSTKSNSAVKPLNITFLHHRICKHGTDNRRKHHWNFTGNAVPLQRFKHIQKRQISSRNSPKKISNTFRKIIFIWRHISLLGIYN